MKHILVGVSALWLAVVPAWAVLGQSLGSVQSDQRHLHAELRTIPGRGFMIHQISREGMVIREYASPAGIVFAVAWNSSTMPDLKQLLGAYFPRVQQASQQHAAHRAPLILRTPDFVFESGGHMRSFHGRAYLINSLPQGMSEDEVQ